MYFELYSKLKQFAAKYPEQMPGLTQKELEKIDFEESEEDEYDRDYNAAISWSRGFLMHH